MWCSLRGLRCRGVGWGGRGLGREGERRIGERTVDCELFSVVDFGDEKLEFVDLRSLGVPLLEV